MAMTLLNNDAIRITDFSSITEFFYEPDYQTLSTLAGYSGRILQCLLGLSVTIDVIIVALPNGYNMSKANIIAIYNQWVQS